MLSPSSGLSLWMREGYHWLFIFAWTSHDSVLQPTGRKAGCITDRVSVCFGAELWRRATWKHSPGMHAFSSSFAQSTGIRGSGLQCVLTSVHVCLSVCLRMRVGLCLLYVLKVIVANAGIKDSADWATRRPLSRNSISVNFLVGLRSYLAISQHDNPHQHHIDLCSQRLVMVDFIHLEVTCNRKQF